MSRLAPGRTHDMAMLLERRSQAIQYSDVWNNIQLKIDDLIEEGNCNTMHSLRGRLVKAAQASDHDEIVNISHQIDKHNKTHHRRRFTRSWVKQVKKG